MVKVRLQNWAKMYLMIIGWGITIMMMLKRLVLVNLIILILKHISII